MTEKSDAFLDRNHYHHGTTAMMIDKWQAVPARANWLAMDKDGTWYWYCNLPSVSEHTICWIANGGFGIAGKKEEAPETMDWMKTLTKR